MTKSEPKYYPNPPFLIKPKLFPSQGCLAPVTFWEIYGYFSTLPAIKQLSLCESVCERETSQRLHSRCQLIRLPFFVTFKLVEKHVT